jgi:zinc finger protein
MMEILKNQTCPICGKKKLELKEEEKNIDGFGKVYVLSMDCGGCDFSKCDIESEEEREGSSQTIIVDSEKDMKIKIVRSSLGTIKIPQIRMSIESGESSEGFITDVEGLIRKFEAIVEKERDSSEDPSAKKSAKNLLKKLWKVKLGDVPLKITIEDPTGNSAIISDKVETKKFKKK